MKRTFSFMPEWAKATFKSIRKFLQGIPHCKKGRYCPVCDNRSREFQEFGRVPRKNALCPHCGSLERHRFVWLYFNKRTDLFDGRPKKMLHVAPEKCFEHILRKRLGDNYITADLLDPHVMVKMDIMDIQYPDESFDVIYCCHVLEHIPDDRQAMREFYRVLKPNGWAILLVPVYLDIDETIEDPSVMDPDERLQVFGQEDHVRKYGPDFFDRLREAGFNVTITKVSDIVSMADAEYMGITRGRCGDRDIYYCTK